MKPTTVLLPALFSLAIATVNFLSCAWACGDEEETFTFSYHLHCGQTEDHLTETCKEFATESECLDSGRQMRGIYWTCIKQANPIPEKDESSEAAW